MTPKEKAEQLFKKMCNADVDYPLQCALIAVDEILENARMKYSESDAPTMKNEMFILDYWQEVKKELEAL